MNQNIKYSNTTIDETIKLTESNIETGLSNEEAQKRLTQYGYNQLDEGKQPSFFQIFFNELKDPMIFVLLAAIFLTFLVSLYETIKCIKAGEKFSFLETGDWADIIIILAVIIMNGLIGTIQEMKASSALQALRKMSSPESTVIRDGKIMKIKSSELVYGDLVVLEEGDTIGADLRLVQSASLKVDEASLTGESEPVKKDANAVFDKDLPIADQINLVYMSTPVTQGRGRGIVIRTGMDTEIGKIAGELNKVEDETTPLQKSLAKLSKFLGLLTLGIVVVVLLAEIIWLIIDGNGSDAEAWIEAVLSSISLAVAAIPEGLPAVVAIVLSLGVQRMVKVNTIVRKLHSVETLGAVKIVCSDKTGTLTQNKMTVVQAWTKHTGVILRKDFKDHKEQLELLASGMSLCSNASVDNGIYGDPTEVALVNFGNDLDLHKDYLESNLPRVDELPFDSVRKMMTTLHQNGRSFTKGALDSILRHATKILENGTIRDITDEDIKVIYEQNTSFSHQALRVLALAYRDDNKLEEENLIFVGLVAMVDPPRPESKESVIKLRQAGITTVMITGDHKDTAFAIAKELTICDDISQCLTGMDVDRLSEEELKEACKTVRVFARVSPQNKVQIVRAFKALGNISAMTGDGVNDAPSLKAADIGIAMGIQGTDVAKDAADMVLTDDNFASIEKAVEEGRGIYKNIKKTIIFLLSSNIAEVLSMFLLIVIGLPIPLIAIHLLWINLITDSLPAIALGVDPLPKDIMNEKPRDPNESIFAGGGFKKILIYGFTITISVIIAYLSIAWEQGAYSISAIKSFYSISDNLTKAQVMAFLTLAFCELFHMIGMSAENKSFVTVFKKKNILMIVAFVVGALLQLAVIEIPGLNAFFKTNAEIGIKNWLIAFLCSIFPLFVHEVLTIINKIKNK